MDVLTTIFYFVITIGILVFIHELGHFLAAKLTGMRVERFSIGFPPRAFGKQIGETDYCISWIPIGGYVKISGMVDESFDTEFAKSEPKPWEFRAKPMWAKVFVISAGVVMNVLLAVAIFWGINYANGKFLRMTTEVGYVVPGSVVEKAGLMGGDKIVTVKGKQIVHWDEIVPLLYIETAAGDVPVEIERAGELTLLTIPQSSLSDMAIDEIGLFPAHTIAVIGAVEPGRPADRLGLKPRDIIVSLAGTPVFNQHQVIQIIQAHAGRELEVEWKRGDELLAGVTVPSEEGRIGISIGSVYVGPTEHMKFSFLGALPEGVRDIGVTLALVYKSIVQLVRGHRAFSESFGGPIKIAQFATQSAEGGMTSFLAFMALLSMSLAILNILPIPALDGGHLVFILIEGVLRREISTKVKLGIQQAGFILLLAFMAFVIYNDILNL